jgi:alkylated DNA repair dioxygenase AlkB
MNLLFPQEKIVFDLPDAEIEYHPSLFDSEKSNELFQLLKNEIPWQHDEITVYGKKHFQPRLTSLYGNDGKSYGYSNIIMRPNRWNPLLMFIKNNVESICNENFTTVLLNYYRDGKDSNGWHADNEKELGRNPIIASVSFGVERVFQLKHNVTNQRQSINLENGSLLVMKGATQHFWKHQIPKSSKEIGARINLTFRIIK